MTDSELGLSLIRVARSAIGAEFGLPADRCPEHGALNGFGATFVTLTQAGHVRGCIGTLQAVRPLRVDVHENAIGAAFRDPRFPPLVRDEFDITAVEVSLLSASEPLTFTSEEDLLARLRPDIDGVTIEYGPNRATFLPQVWQTLCEPQRFMAELKRKAGLPIDFWDAQMNVSRYQVTKWEESDFTRA
jgi:AmmeMemoRadiSam system protein A